MRRILIVFGGRSKLVSIISGALACDDVFNFSSFLVGREAYGNYLPINFVTEHLLPALGLESYRDIEKIYILYSGPFSRQHRVKLDASLRSLGSLYSLITLLSQFFNSTKLDLSIIGSSEVAVPFNYDHYRAMKNVEFSLFFEGMRTSLIPMPYRYFLVPTFRPTRRIGKFIAVEREQLALRIAHAINSSRIGIGVYSSFFYGLLALPIILRCRKIEKFFNY